jgi:demethylmenaquinone methyltransferase/2-methoxy-6-polyprenyl-1,4-benzoquinol methylase
MFDAIAGRYDGLNRLMSLGLDRSWRRRAVAAVALGGGGKALDLATGTGDVALLLASQQPTATVVGIDPSAAMLAIAEKKAHDAGASRRVSFELGDAQALHFGEQSFDAVTMAFGIRNVVDRPRALGEMRRVLKPGGRVAILELSEPDGRFVASLAKLYVHEFVPRLGAMLSRAPAYRYLEQSIAAFPAPAQFAQMMESEGLHVVAMERMSFGAAWLFVGLRRGREGEIDGPRV